MNQNIVDERMNSGDSVGEEIYKLASELFPICRSLTGAGVRETLAIIQREIPELQVHEVPSGTACFDWTVPPEWNIRDAYVIGPDSEVVVDFKQNNLHVVGYSVPIKKTLSLQELQKHLHSLPDQPDAIPYVTSYYNRYWGFCLTEKQRRSLKPGDYQVFIDSTLEPGNLTYADLVLPGQSEDEVLLSSYICHPSLANNELSGPTVATYLAKWLRTRDDRRYTYRIVFVPETIGSIVYLSKHLSHLKDHVVAGFGVMCAGDDRAYSYLPSRNGNTIADRVLEHVLKHHAPNYKKYSFLDRGGDERQYCSPGVDLPFAVVSRSFFRSYPEYHTSKDNLDLISPEGLGGTFAVLRKCFLCLERNERLTSTVLCEPQLSNYGLYPTLSTRDRKEWVRTLKDLFAFSDGVNDLLEIANIIGLPMWELFDLVDKLKKLSLLQGTNSD